jgi:hypothetical protein
MLSHRQGAPAGRMLCDELRSSNEAGVDDRIQWRRVRRTRRRSALPPYQQPSRTLIGNVVPCLTGGLDRRAFGCAAGRDCPAAAKPRRIDAQHRAGQWRGPPQLAGDTRPARDRSGPGGAPRQSGPPGRGPQTRAAPRPSRRPKRPRRARRRTAPPIAAAIEQLLSARDTGLSARAIAGQATANYAATLSLLRELEVSGQVRREGAPRTTAWRLITDEDRIAQRVAELERPTAPSGTRQARAPEHPGSPRQPPPAGPGLRRLQGGPDGVQNRGAAYAEPIGVDRAAAPLGRSAAGPRNDPDVGWARRLATPGLPDEPNSLVASWAEVLPAKPTTGVSTPRGTGRR